MRVCIISQYFPPDTGGASTRAWNVADSLEKRGHEVTVITAFPHYPRGVIPSIYKRKILAIEYCNGVRVVRVWIPPLPHQGTTKRLIMYVSFALSSLMALPLCRGTRVTWAMSPNYLCMLPATVCKATTRSKVIHDVVDIWPEALVATGYFFSRKMLSITNLVTRLSYAFSDSIITVSESMRKTLRHIVPIAIPVEVVENCVTDPFFEIPPKDKTSTLHVMYLGTLGPSNDFFSLVQAAGKLQSNEYARFSIVGSGEQAEKIGEWVKQLGLSNVDLFNGAVDHTEVPAWLEKADVLVLPMRKGFGDTSLPSKLGEYLASGRPVICLVDGKMAATIRDSNMALLVDAGDVEGLVDAIKRLYRDPSLLSTLGWKGREYALTHLGYDSFRKKIDNLLEFAAKVA